MKEITIFDYLDYLMFIKDYIECLPNNGRGFRKILSDKLNCQMSFISHVLNGDKDLTIEQAFKVSELFPFSAEEKEYWINLHSYNRAGTVDLKNYYLAKLGTIKSNYQAQSNKSMSTDALSFVDQAIYYSSWFYSAIHMGSYIPHLQNTEKMRRYLDLDKASFNEAIEFLASRNLINLEGEKMTPGKMNLYVETSSVLMSQYHNSWRLKLMEEYKKRKETDLNFTLCFSISDKDFSKMRQDILKLIEENLKMIETSKEEKLGFLCIDLKEL